MKIMMVCIGNICRSPMAEGIMKQLINERGLPWIVDSSGIASYHIGASPHPFSQKICQNHGVDISGQRAKLFQPVDFSRFDKIYAMEPEVLEKLKHLASASYDAGQTDLLLNEIYPGENRAVPDPWYGNEEGYSEVFDLIDQTCRSIVQKYTSLPYSELTYRKTLKNKP